jgi:hypothetical protein
MASIQKYRSSFGHFALAFVAATCLFSNAIAHPQTEEESRARIQKLISTTFDRPGLKVQTDPIVIEGKVAIADWIQGEKGGRALLTRKHVDWEIIACGGAGFKDPSVIAGAGISKRIANNITEKLKIAEAKLPPQKVKQLDSFDGVVTMGRSSRHEPKVKH